VWQSATQSTGSIVALEIAAKPGQTGGMIASSTDAIATLRFEIKYIEPLVWRRVALRTSMNLMALHKIIQAPMGWLDRRTNRQCRD
jgi:hypothetical protein